jgi:hypothetical protein
MKFPEVYGDKSPLLCSQEPEHSISAQCILRLQHYLRRHVSSIQSSLADRWAIRTASAMCWCHQLTGATVPAIRVDKTSCTAIHASNLCDEPFRHEDAAECSRGSLLQETYVDVDSTPRSLHCVDVALLRRYLLPSPSG